MNNATVDDRANDLLEFARKKKRSSKTWIDLHNRIYGIGGKLVEFFPHEKDRIAFAKTAAAKEIGELIDSFDGDDSGFSEVRNNANGKILVRVPKSVHAALIMEAESEGISLNQLCAAKLAIGLSAVVQ